MPVRLRWLISWVVPFQTESIDLLYIPDSQTDTLSKGESEVGFVTFFSLFKWHFDYPKNLLLGYILITLAAANAAFPLIEIVSICVLNLVIKAFIDFIKTNWFPFAELLRREPPHRNAKKMCGGGNLNKIITYIMVAELFAALLIFLKSILYLECRSFSVEK